MTVVQSPTILASRSSLGVIPSTARGNVSWSDDGQCLYITKRNVQILTPYLSTASPPPPSLVDPNLSLEHPTQTVYRAKNPRPSAQTQQAKNQDANAVAGPSTRLRRPATGEIPLYATSIEIDSQSSRDDEHGWKEVGDEISAPPMGVDAHVRAAAWSPSGCSDLGGCLLAVMLNTGQVTIWGPRSDPMSKQWDELADLTGQLAQIAVEEGLETMTVRRMLQMRSTCMEWAPPIPLSCRDQALSMLAVGNRAGEIHIWASSRVRQFTRLLVVPVGQTWVTHVTWASDWRAAGRTGAQEEWTTELLCALADGSTHRVTVRLTRTAQGGSGVRHTDIHIVSGPDKCPVTALASTPDVLIWTKASTVYIHAAGSGSRARWRGLKTIRLSRVGNWAGANPFNPCVGIQVLSHDRLVVVLSSLTHHIIENLLTEPTLADPVESLRASLAARDVLLDFFHNESTKKDRLRMSADNDRDVTAHTIGWEAISTDGAIVSSVSEPINFHNLDAATEGHRFLLFSITDMSASLAPSARGSLGPTEELAAILADPPCLLDVAPQRILLPILARAVGAPQTEAVAEEMLGLCQVAPRLPAVPNGKVAIGDLLSYMWSSRAMDASRLRVVIAQWCSKALSDVRAARAKRVHCKLQDDIHLVLLALIVRWVEAQPDVNVSELDQRMMTALRHAVDRTYTLSDVGSASKQLCPACREPISGGDTADAKCTKGHTWARCSLTQLIIVDPDYRVCSSCSAVALAPWSPEVQGTTAKEVLACATHCVICGGRWTKAI